MIYTTCLNKEDIGEKGSRKAQHNNNTERRSIAKGSLLIKGTYVFGMHRFINTRNGSSKG